MKNRLLFKSKPFRSKRVFFLVVAPTKKIWLSKRELTILPSIVELWTSWGLMKLVLDPLETRWVSRDTFPMGSKLTLMMILC